MKYTVDYFIDKFSKIPDSKFISGLQCDNKGNHCAYGWCATKFYYSSSGNGHETEEGQALTKLFTIPELQYLDLAGEIPEGMPARINNGDHPKYQQPTPKQRILAALNDVKKFLEANQTRTDITKSLAVIPVDERVDTVQAPQTILSHQ